MLQPAILPTDNRPVSDRTGPEFLHANRSRTEAPIEKRGFSSVFESLTQQRPRPSDRPLPPARRERPAHEADRSDPPRRAASLESSRRPRGAGSLASRDSRGSSATSAAADHASVETEPTRARKTGRTDAQSQSEHDQAAEQDETVKNQGLEVMVCFSVCVTAPVAVNGDSHAPAGDAQVPVGAIGTQAVPPTADAVTEEPALRAAEPLMDPTIQQAPGPAGQGEDNSAQPGVKPGPLLTDLVPPGEDAAQPAMADGQPVADAATAASLPATDGEAAGRNDADRLVSAGTSLPSDAPSSRNLRGGMEEWQQSDYAVPDLMVENRASSEWLQSGGSQDHAMGDRDDRSAGGMAESSSPGHSHLHGEPGFGETVAALAADKSPSSDGGASRTNASSLTGRPAAPSWPTGEERPSWMQAVSLDLEPADLGPVNVRIFMTDRTVHAYIRTDHMDLGQGMLNQQQQLETKLQSSGLEMGAFTVTVDQQQLSRGDSQGWLRQEGEWRPSTGEPDHRASDSDAREPLTAERQHRSGIVSFFA